jgi:hypothetical protein
MLIVRSHHCHFRSPDCIYAVIDGNYGITALYRLCSSGISERTRQLSCPANNLLHLIHFALLLILLNSL